MLNKIKKSFEIFDNRTSESVYFRVASKFIEVIFPYAVLIWGIVEFLQKSNLLSLTKTITTMTIGEVIYYGAIGLCFYYLYLIVRDRVKHRDEMKALKKALQERTEALEADLYRQVFLHGLLKKYVIEQLPQETKSLEDFGYHEATVRFLFDCERDGSKQILTSKKHQLNKTKPLEISKREDLEKKFIDIHWANIQKY